MRSSSSQKVALALRVLEGCFLLYRDCATAAHRYNAVKKHAKTNDGLEMYISQWIDARRLFVLFDERDPCC
ncbi:hypothetical protein E2562_004107 [Oryza meyeriana var. granulata]|uniref:Uncharacterized protein n=1 Tax=Oryza meyeriana var. granulata TaxID=110450 RepID=A0A6G1EV03_9ORYZ|nr:hypothetical protein E2562_004107 [Oryza meyeriana var. granulata]